MVIRLLFTAIPDVNRGQMMNQSVDRKQKYIQKKREIRQNIHRLKQEEKQLKKDYRSGCDTGAFSDTGYAEREQEISEETDDSKAYRLKHSVTEIGWSKLDNTALMYPMITGEEISNVYRLSVTLNEDVEQEKLQMALQTVLPKFRHLKVRLRQGFFWYYFEENKKKIPEVKREDSYPCSYINSLQNNDYLFRVTYFRKRINLEMFHVLTDGNGAMDFLKELTYQYLRLTHRELSLKLKDELSSTTSLNTEDGFYKNYEKKPLKRYRFSRAFIMKGLRLPEGVTGVLTGYMPVSAMKQAAKRYGASLNEFLVALVTYSIYEEYRNTMNLEEPVVTCVPVNLRPYFHSVTAKNFFVNVSAVFQPENRDQGFEEVISAVKKSLREQITKEHLQEILSQNVSSEKNFLTRTVPLVFKKPALRQAYRLSSHSTTLTVSNMGIVNVDEPYIKYIQHFNVILAKSRNQNLKVGICSFQGEMAVSFISVFRRTGIQKTFFTRMVQEGVPVRLESNGVYT